MTLNDTDGVPLSDPSMYRRLLGSQIYLTISQLDIAFVVNRLSQFMNKPRTPHLLAVHHLLQYLKTVPGQGLLFPAALSLRLSTFCDANWGSCTTFRRSTTGFCIFLGSALISWKSKKQTTVARSSAEVQYRSLTTLTSELLWIRQLLRSLDIYVASTAVYSDSKSAIRHASNPTYSKRSKHIDIDCHFIREHVHNNFIKLVHVEEKWKLEKCSCFEIENIEHKRWKPLFAFYAFLETRHMSF